MRAKLRTSSKTRASLQYHYWFDEGHRDPFPFLYWWLHPRSLDGLSGGCILLGQLSCRICGQVGRYTNGTTSRRKRFFRGTSSFRLFRMLSLISSSLVSRTTGWQLQRAHIWQFKNNSILSMTEDSIQGNLTTKGENWCSTCTLPSFSYAKTWRAIYT
mgnify:CR=1 FL=1